jgi:hypothetical protein
LATLRGSSCMLRPTTEFVTVSEGLVREGRTPGGREHVGGTFA